MTKLADIIGYLTGRNADVSHRPAKLEHPLKSIRFGYQAGLIISGNGIELSLIKCQYHRRSLIKTVRFDLDDETAIDWDFKLINICRLTSEFLDGHNKNRIPINIGLAGDNIAQRRIYLPHMPASELTQAALWEGEKLFPFKFEDCYVGQEIVNLNPDEPLSQIGINLTAVQKTIINFIYNKFPQFGLNVGQIGYVPDIISSLAIEEMFGLPPGCYLILFINPTNSYAAFVKNRRLEFYQQFITQPRENEVGQITNLSMLSSELISFLDMFAGIGQGIAPKAVVLAGQYAQQAEVRQYFEKGMTCYDFSDASSFPGLTGKYDAQQSSRFLPAIQTALLTPRQKPLAPAAIRKKDQYRVLTNRLALAAVIGFLIVAGLQTVDYLKRVNDRAALESLQGQVAAFEKSPGYQKYMEILAKLNRGKALLTNDANRNQSRFHFVLKELSLTIPDELCLTSLAYDCDSTGYHLQLGGSVKLRDFSPEIVLAHYIEQLDKSPMFRNVKVVHHSKSKKFNQFDLIFQIRMDAGV